MANPLQRASVRRKVMYLGAILGLFTISLVWRGKFPVPVGKPNRDEEVAAGKVAAPTGLTAFADRLARAPIAEQAGRLELRELDQGDPEIAATAMRLSLVGSRGLVITALWRAAIEKQKRGEWHEMERLVRTVTRLQPNFISPWLFQSWNIAYNVSVENDKLGDMYYYIARGVELLSEGDRLNTKDYRAPDGELRRIGSPDIRHMIGFTVQNKFAVSDKVNTLRCLMQLSVIPPDQRDPKRLQRAQKIDPVEFKKFCLKNPRLVRRLYTQLGYQRPEDVVQFLEDNYKVPCRYTATGELARDEEQFPILPPAYKERPDEPNPRTPLTEDTHDAFDAFDVARAWFGYAIATIPPTKRDPYTGQPMPWASPVAGEYDQFKYRMPRSPAYILFRQQLPRAQTYLAERLGAEGWFDEQSTWTPDARASAGNLWLKASEGEPDVLLKPASPSASAREQWRIAYQMWKTHGDENALVMDEATFRNYASIADRVPGPRGQLPQAGEFTPEKLAALGLTQHDVDVKKALIYYEQNRSMTNFPYFLASSEAEQDPLTIEARRLLATADEARKNAENAAAIRDYVRGLAVWRTVLIKYPDFHRRAVGSDRTEEETYETELELTGLLREDGAVRRRADRQADDAAGALLGAARFAGPDDRLGLLRANVLADEAEDEARARVTALDPRVIEAGQKYAEKAAFGAHHAAHALTGAAVQHTPAAVPALKAGLAGSVVNGEFAWLKEFKTKPIADSTGELVPTDDDYWVRPTTREVVRGRLGLTRENRGADTGEGK